MQIQTFDERESRLPQSGRWLVGRRVHASIVVYQSLPSQIAEVALANGRFDSPFDFNRLSWIKPSFLWTMHRTDWGRLDDYVLAVHVRLDGFMDLLKNSVSAKYEKRQYAKKREWDRKIKGSNVLTQWDPEYDVADRRMNRLALQVGLRGQSLRTYARELITRIDDVSQFVRQQRAKLSCESSVEVPNEVVIPMEKPVGRFRTGTKYPVYPRFNRPLADSMLACLNLKQLQSQRSTGTDAKIVLR